MPEDVYVRFEGIVGECMDEKHPGVDGWFQIKSFNFSFSAKDKGENPPAAGIKKLKGKTEEERLREVNDALQKVQQARDREAKGKKKDSAKDEAPHDHPDVSVSKVLDSASATIWGTKCYEGKTISKVEVEACRSGGTSDEKIPFVRLVFESVYVTKISMSIPEDALPSESLDFHYERVRIESIWTDNETGERRVDRPQRFGWDFENNKRWDG